MNCRVYALKGELSGGQYVDQLGKFSHESEHDLALMVRDFLENSSGGADSICSSDSDSGYSDLSSLSDKVLIYKHMVNQFEHDLLSKVNSILISTKESDLVSLGSGSCNASCIRLSLAKRLRISGYDAAVCVSKWHGSSQVLGGGHEYVDVLSHGERLIIDIDFRSHFEIARAVDSYDRILASLPIIYIGNLSKLKHLLQVMVEAAKSSLRQNSMPLPPWRSFAYLQAKWQSPYQRLLCSDPANRNHNNHISLEQHRQCCRHLRRLQFSLHSDLEMGWIFKPISDEFEKRLQASVRSKNKHTKRSRIQVAERESSPKTGHLKRMNSDPSNSGKMERDGECGRTPSCSNLVH